MNTKHTPGPWRVEVDTAEDAAWAQKWPTIQAENYEVVGTEGFYGDIETDIANARLIAAAPETAAERDKLKEINAELLEALKDIVTYWDSIVPTDCINDMHIKARAAIAKCE